MSVDARVDLVARSYDAIADRFAAWRVAVQGDPTQRYVQELLTRVPQGSPILELGCGNGDVSTSALSTRFRVTAVDVSAAQIERARKSAPAATIVQGDLLELTFAAGTFAAVCSFNVFNHVPRERLGGLLERIAVWLDPGGLLVASFGMSDTDSGVGEWHGSTTFFSSWPPEVNRTLVEAAGFKILSDELVAITEPPPEPGAVTFQWIMACR